MSRIEATFEQLQAQGRKALIPYVTAGYPHADITPALMHVLVEAGADIIELGVPFSDPSADGPIIQAAGEYALRHGIGLPTVFEQVSQFRQTNTSTPVVLMGYANPIERYDQLRYHGAFAEDAAKAGVDGVLVVDYPPEMSSILAAQLHAHDLDLIFLLAPTSTDTRIQHIAKRASGYVYGVSIKGVTGAATLDPAQVHSMVTRIRRHVDIPIGIGFGIRDGQTAREIAQMADAVIIGSWLLERLANKSAAQALAIASDLIKDIRQHVDLDMPEPARTTKHSLSRQ